MKHLLTTRTLQTTKIKWDVCFSLTKDSLYQTLRSKSYLPLRGNNPRPLDVNFEILTTTPLWYTQWENFKTLYYTKSNSCSDTLLSFHFLGVIWHNFALESHTHSPEFLDDLLYEQILLRAETFKRKKIREIVTFHEHNLSRMGQKSFFWRA